MHNSTVHASNRIYTILLNDGSSREASDWFTFDFEGSDCSNTNVQEYVTEHFEKMKAAYRKAGERLEREAANRKELYDVKASEQKLDLALWYF